MLNARGLVAATVYARNKRDEEKREQQQARRLVFANGKFITEPEEGPQTAFPPLGTGDQDKSFGCQPDSNFGTTA